MSGDPWTVAFHTLGCKVNQYDSAAVASLLREHGFTVVPFGEKADVYVVNTCTVTATGDKKSRQALRRARRQNESAVVVAMGCYSQTDPSEVADTTGADLVFGTGDRDHLVNLVLSSLNARRTSGGVFAERVHVRPVCEYESYEDISVCDALDRTRAFVKIQDGCEQYCTYCKVPYARGRVRSRGLRSVLSQVEYLSSRGFREVVLIGIHLGMYGSDLAPDTDLASVTSAVAEVAGISRVRLGSVECTELTPRLLDVVSRRGNVCRHLHVPLQSGDDRVLQRMGRPYSAQEYLEAISAVRERIPGCAISADVMVGFPGESDDEFARCMEFVEQCRFSRLHVFGYSRRKGTPAASAPGQVDRRVIAHRIRTMDSLGKELARKRHQTMVGRRFSVLVEGRDLVDLMPFGHTDTYVRVRFSAPDAACRRNELASVRITSAGAEGLLGIYEGNAGLAEKV